jgi:hypothetical protein
LDILEVPSASLGDSLDFLDALFSLEVIFVGNVLHHFIAFVIALVTSRFVFLARGLERSKAHCLHFFGLCLLSTGCFFFKVFLFP